MLESCKKSTSPLLLYERPITVGPAMQLHQQDVLRVFAKQTLAKYVPRLNIL